MDVWTLILCYFPELGLFLMNADPSTESKFQKYWMHQIHLLFKQLNDTLRTFLSNLEMSFLFLGENDEVLNPHTQKQSPHIWCPCLWHRPHALGKLGALQLFVPLKPSMFCHSFFCPYPYKPKEESIYHVRTNIHHAPFPEAPTKLPLNLIWTNMMLVLTRRVKLFYSICPSAHK